MVKKLNKIENESEFSINYVSHKTINKSRLYRNRFSFYKVHMQEVHGNNDKVHGHSSHVNVDGKGWDSYQGSAKRR
jgi:hypothetical protein